MRKRKKKPVSKRMLIWRQGTLRVIIKEAEVPALPPGLTCLSALIARWQFTLIICATLSGKLEICWLKACAQLEVHSSCWEWADAVRDESCTKHPLLKSGGTMPPGTTFHLLPVKSGEMHVGRGSFFLVWQWKYTSSCTHFVLYSISWGSCKPFLYFTSSINKSSWISFPFVSPLLQPLTFIWAEGPRC